MISANNSLRPGILTASMFAGVLLTAGSVLADETAQVVVEAKAPVHSQHAADNTPGGARVDVLSVQYHVHLSGLDLSKRDDFLQAQEQVKLAAKKACTSIQAEYPTRPMSDEQGCEADATARGMDQLNKLAGVKHK